MRVEDSLDHPAGATPHSIRLDEVLVGILNSAPFSSSKQSQHLLQYLVEKSSQRGDELLKERVIGTEVFGRTPDYNTSEDPIVRARVGDVRKRLAQYYLSEESRHAKVQIFIPPGSYRAVYKVHDDSGATRAGLGIAGTVQVEESVVTAPSSSNEVAAQSEKKTSRYVGISGGAIFACLILSWAIFRWHPGTQSALDQFWSPVLRDSKQVVIYAGTNAVYAPIWDPKRPDISAQHDVVLPVLAPGEALTSKEVRAVNYELTTVGDLLATVYITSLLSTWHVGIDVRTGENIAIGDLRHSPAILIGGANNPWTLSMSKTLPIAYVRNVGIQDQSGNHTLWVDSLNADSTSGESYAIIARLLNPETGKPLIMIAGLSSLGTRVAGQFITDPVLLKTLTSTAPAGWANKNLEVVLRTKVLSRDAGSPTIVAVRYW
jgi:hypothetical protein